MIIFKVSYPFAVPVDTVGSLLDEVIYYPSIVDARADTKKQLDEMVKDAHASKWPPDADGFYTFVISRVTVADVSRSILCEFLNGETLRKPILVSDEVVEKICLRPNFNQTPEPDASVQSPEVMIGSNQ